MRFASEIGSDFSQVQCLLAHVVCKGDGNCEPKAMSFCFTTVGLTCMHTVTCRQLSFVSIARHWRMDGPALPWPVPGEAWAMMYIPRHMHLLYPRDNFDLTYCQTFLSLSGNVFFSTVLVDAKPSSLDGALQPSGRTNVGGSKPPPP